jgi:outer membrane protein OmpA-like peptidoglycan-associated protein
MRRLAALCVLCLFCPAAPLAALVLEFPAPAQQTAERLSAFDSHRIAISPYREGSIDRIVAEGFLQQRAWRVGQGRLTTLELLAPIRAQIEADGFDVLFECADRGCGGFDFRFEADVLPQPEMYVDIGDFRYLAARRSGPNPEYLSVVVSRSAAAGFVQLTRIGPPDESVVLELDGTGAEELEGFEPAEIGSEISARLLEEGHSTLAGLRFETGSAELSGGPYEALDQLAEFLREDPARRVVLVGHTDAEGALEGNIALSRRRAEAVAERMVSGYGIAPGRITAEGVGYLAPVASNRSEDGRRANRRVEAVLVDG